MNKQLEQMVTNLTTNLVNIFKEDEEKDLVTVVKQEDADVNFFTAQMLAVYILFRKLEGYEEIDLLEFISILNKLAVQFLLEEQKEEISNE